MRCHWPVIGAIALLGVIAPSARAGVYSTLAVELNFKINDQYFNVFNNTSLIPLRQVGTKNGLDDWQKLYALTGAALDLPKLTSLRDVKKADPLTEEQRLNLATCLLRLRRPADAIEILRRIDKPSFVVMSTLGTAHLIAGDYRTASDWLSEAGSTWRKNYSLKPGAKEESSLTEGQRKYLLENFKWTEHEFGWYANCENYLRYLTVLRAREFKGAKAPLAFSKALTKLDDLFPYPRPKDAEPVRFVGESGEFEPGKIAAAEKAKLPRDALLVVQQLLIWMPDDYRLAWLLGELLNAQGSVDAATLIFRDYLKKFAYQETTGNWPSADNASDKAIPDLPFLPKFIATYPEVGNRLKALLDYKAPPPELPKVLVDLPVPEPANDKTPTSVEPTAGQLKVDWLQALVVGFGGGAVVGLIAARKWREMRQRRQAQTGAASQRR